MRPIYTIGHSALSQQEFLARCRSARIDEIVDIRSHPVSKWDHYNLEVLEAPDSWLAEAGIQYRWEPRLGGWSNSGLNDLLTVEADTAMPVARTAKPGAFSGRKQTVRHWATRKGIPIDLYSGRHFPRVHAGKVPAGGLTSGWQNQGQSDYAWYTALPTFHDAVHDLIGQTRADERAFGFGTGLMCTEFVWWKCHRAQVADVLCWLGIPVMHVQPTEVRHSDMFGRRLRNYPDQIKDTWGPRRKMKKIT